MRRFSLFFSLVLAALAIGSAHAQHAAGNSLLGDWQEPGGSAIQVAPCSPDRSDMICLTLRAISRDAGSKVDGRNPDPSLRSRPLCGLMIGRSFRMIDGAHADDGQLYDPRSGKTYTGSITGEGDRLKLRGYVGLKLFGRSETWTRVAPGQFTPCQP